MENNIQRCLTKNCFCNLYPDQCVDTHFANARYNLSQLAKQKSYIKDEYQRISSELAQYKKIVGAINGLTAGEYWAWDPNGENHLETLSCPVLIPAEWLRNMLAAAKGNLDREIVCLCGSQRFYRAFADWNLRFTVRGLIVLNGCNPGLKPTPEEKVKLAELHRRKIDLANWLFILDVGGYIGEDTQKEIDYARSQGKGVRFLSSEYPDYIEPVFSLETA